MPEYLPGPGDEATWGACTGHPNDPRTERDEDDDGFDSMTDEDKRQLLTELSDDQARLLAALERLTALILTGRHYETRNPYSRPEVEQALKAIAKSQGKSTFGCDWMDAIDTRRFPN